ncbi:PEPxxWA-CTERM sorting domain-containing protein [Sandarakinorhabdus limnophila]|uniref:PEPxxWA-CTERM sorting domain-containing protein n=1 Tax=Sandarakinorhabdus limnophila TaxID=210512 RepID=UPI0026EEE42D|nr:PEPxxWA-CTERM sorting domain-containing protein [Sandarakinorhabdus limnophila]
MLATLGTAAVLPSVASAQLIAQKYFLTRRPAAINIEAGQTFDVDPNGISSTVFNQGMLNIGFEGISQYDVAAVGRNFIPPDTIGAAGRTQYVQFTNGGFAVYDKATGTRSLFSSDTAFWQAAGQAGVPNGDQRVIFSPQANKFIAISFGSNTKDILVAVSDTGNALGTWKSTKFEGFAELTPGGRTLADYPTLAFDNNAVYIGTNDFAAATVGGPTNFRGTTLNVIPLSDILGAGGPNVVNNVQFRTAFTGNFATDDFSRGFAIQGVNSSESTDGIGHIIAASINDFGLTRYDVLNAGTAGAVRTATGSTTIGTDYTFNDFGRQPASDAIVGNPALPNGIAANRRIIDTFGDQISSSAFEHAGKIYSVHTVTENGTDRTVVRYTVLDTATNAVLDEGNLGDAAFDFYQGALAVNRLGQVVISYNRSGLGPDGRITLAAQTFRTNALGQLVSTGDEIVLRVSDTDDYHNGSLYGQAAAGRQRWADYATVTLDPMSVHSFWISGTFAREYNLGAFGHPGGTGGSRWGTYIAELNVGGVPEPQSWAMLIIGFGLIGAVNRRQRQPASC